MRKKLLKHLNKATSLQSQSEAELNKALKVWLEQYDFPEEIKRGFSIAFTSGSETTIFYQNRSMERNTDLLVLVDSSKECVIDIFDIEL